MAAKITGSLPSSLMFRLDRFARKWETTRSGAVAELLRRSEQEEIEKEMKEGYTALSENGREEAEPFLPTRRPIHFFPQGGQVFRDRVSLNCLGTPIHAE